MGSMLFLLNLLFSLGREVTSAWNVKDDWKTFQNGATESGDSSSVGFSSSKLNFNCPSIVCAEAADLEMYASMNLCALLSASKGFKVNPFGYIHETCCYL